MPKQLLAIVIVLWVSLPVAAANPRLDSWPAVVSPELRELLDAARDGTDIGDEAYHALLEDAAGWPIEVAGWAAPEWAGRARAVDGSGDLEGEGVSRGAVYRIRGRLEQRREVEGQRGDVEEWAVRDADGTPLLIYVITDDRASSCGVGAEIEVPGRFYKELRLVDASGQLRAYTAFVGARARPLRRPAEDAGLAMAWLVPGMLVGLLAVAFLMVSAWVRRARRRGARSSRGSAARHARDEDAFDAAHDLPEDPAAALAELHGRSGASVLPESR